jgi:aspartate kinase
MRVLKFGGASVKDAEGIRNLARIIEHYGKSEILVVVSAMGKTTNKLEEIYSMASKKKSYTERLGELLTDHRNVARALLGDLPNHYLELEQKLVEALKRVHELPKMQAYDSIIPFGELCSTSIIAAYLNESYSKASWVDARELIRTDQYFTEANIDWVVTEKQVINRLKEPLKDQLVVTQGFIGSDVEGNTTTLGREGSDFTGAIMAYCLNAESFTVFKDVMGILNADPRILSQTEKYDQLSYREVTEMTYYGAQVIHPKTLKPLAQKSIPLLVRSFKDPALEGTMISEIPSSTHVPCFVFKLNQVLVTAQVKDHSFMDEKKLGLILQVLDLLNIKINLMQNSALTLSFCIDDKDFKLKRIKELLNRDFLLSVEKNLKLATIKNYTNHSFTFLPEMSEKIMEQKTSDNYQVLYRD